MRAGGGGGASARTGGPAVLGKGEERREAGGGGVWHVSLQTATAGRRQAGMRRWPKARGGIQYTAACDGTDALTQMAATSGQG